MLSLNQTNINYINRVKNVNNQLLEGNTRNKIKKIKFVKIQEFNLYANNKCLFFNMEYTISIEKSKIDLKGAYVNLILWF